MKSFSDERGGILLSVGIIVLVVLSIIGAIVALFAHSVWWFIALALVSAFAYPVISNVRDRLASS